MNARVLLLALPVLVCGACLRVGFDSLASSQGDAGPDAGDDSRAVDQSGDGPLDGPPDAQLADALAPDARLPDAQLPDAQLPDKGAPDKGITLYFPPGDKVSAGGAHACAVWTKGTVYCWGYNADGVLGNNSTIDSLVPVQAVGLTDIIDVEASEQHTCAVHSNGDIYCWGEDANDTLGFSPPLGYSKVPVKVPGVSKAKSVDAGWDHTCAVLASGDVMCWGDNYFGECGTLVKGGTKPSPVKVVGVSGAVELATGEDFTCARRYNGQVVCWGTYTGGSSSAFTPTAVPNLSDAVEIGAGSNHACAVRATGAVVCWGENGSKQLGSATSGYTLSPVAAGSLAGMVEVIGGQAHSCARHAGGAVSCWGWNAVGLLGRGIPHSTLNETAVPGKVINLLDAVQLSATEDFTCALRKSGGVACWGDNWKGQLGDGTTTDRDAPVAVKGLP